MPPSLDKSAVIALMLFALPSSEASAQNARLNLRSAPPPSIGTRVVPQTVRPLQPSCPSCKIGNAGKARGGTSSGWTGWSEFYRSF
jgi:hypothetical protein